MGTGIIFLIAWLLCSVAFAIQKEPATLMDFFKTVTSGVLIAIAIALLPVIKF